jgi:hypothetical protein
VLVDRSSHAVYVSGFLHATTSIIDGARCNALRTDGCARVPREVAVGVLPIDQALDPGSGTLWVVDEQFGAVSLVAAR